MDQKKFSQIRKDFPWFKYNSKFCYLDNAATSLKPIQVIEAESEYYKKYSCNPHNNDSVFTYHVSELINETRLSVAKLLNVGVNEIIFTSGATQSLNMIAFGIEPFIKKNDEIVLTYLEHASNLLPWFELCNRKHSKIVWAKTGIYPKESDIIKSINKKTKIVAICDVNNIIAYKININDLTQKIKQIAPNVIIIVDATQSIPHIKHDLKNANIDFLAFSAHKMLGPTGVGVCYINSKWLNKIKPIQFGGGMNSIIDADSCSYTYASGPNKFEGGSPNTAGIIGFNAAIKYLNKLGWKNILKHAIALKKYINKRFSEIKNIKYYNKKTIFPIVYFNINGVSAQDLANYLGIKNIIVRSGLSCAKCSYLITKIDAAVRASFYIYNTKQDVDLLVNALKKYKKGDELVNVLKK